MHSSNKMKRHASRLRPCIAAVDDAHANCALGAWADAIAHVEAAAHIYSVHVYIYIYIHVAFVRLRAVSFARVARAYVYAHVLFSRETPDVPHSAHITPQSSPSGLTLNE